MLVLSREVGTAVLFGVDCEMELVVTAIRSDQAELRVGPRSTSGRTIFDIAGEKFSRGDVLQLENGVSCTVVDVRNQKAYLGFDAPRHIQIHRRETWDAVRRLNDGPGDDTAGAAVPR
jgi:sRNA-binding carbon storage regulator CsrA